MSSFVGNPKTGFRASNETMHDKINSLYAPCKDLNQHGHISYLIRVLSLHSPGRLTSKLSSCAK